MILTKIISTAKAEILVIGGLPEDAFNVEISKSHYRGKFKLTFLTKTCIYEDHTIILKEGKWQPVGFLKDLNENDAEKFVVHYAWEDTPDGERWAFKDYITGEETDNYEDMYPYDTAKESLLSLIESEVKLKNPLADSISAPDIDEWQAEQSEVFTNTFILIKK